MNTSGVPSCGYHAVGSRNSMPTLISWGKILRKISHRVFLVVGIWAYTRSKLVGSKHQEQDVISIESRYRSSNNMCSILSIQIKGFWMNMFELNKIISLNQWPQDQIIILLWFYYLFLLPLIQGSPDGLRQQIKCVKRSLLSLLSHNSHTIVTLLSHSMLLSTSQFIFI